MEGGVQTRPPVAPKRQTLTSRPVSTISLDPASLAAEVVGTPPKIYTERHACTIGLKSLFKAINDRTPLPGEARSFFEDTKPQIQCNKTIVSEKTNCWICGNEFSKVDPNLFPQCDHILPISQGVIFLELYSKKTGTVTDAMKLEYEWAHARCNRIKNDSVLMNGTQSNFQPVLPGIKLLLQAIVDKGTPIPDIDKRAEIVEGVIKKITDHVNQLEDYQINLNMKICPKTLVFQGGHKTFKRKNNGNVSKGSGKHRNEPSNGSSSKSNRNRRTKTRRGSNKIYR